MNGKNTILIIDDEEGIKDFLKMTINKILPNFKTLEASNGKEGFTLVDKFHENIALIICDLKMPIMTGQEFLKKLRSNYNTSIPIIILSGHVFGDNIDQITGQSNAYFLNKPWLYKELETLIEKVIN